MPFGEFYRMFQPPIMKDGEKNAGKNQRIFKVNVDKGERTGSLVQRQQYSSVCLYSDGRTPVISGLPINNLQKKAIDGFLLREITAYANKENMPKMNHSLCVLFRQTLSKILCKWKRIQLSLFFISEFCFQT